VSKVLADDDVQVRSVGLGQVTDDIIQELARKSPSLRMNSFRTSVTKLAAESKSFFSCKSSLDSRIRIVVVTTKNVEDLIFSVHLDSDMEYQEFLQKFQSSSLSTGP
jgi:hypothetical protein